MSSPQSITWRNEFATGVAEIDEQHMILIHTLNDAGTRLAVNHDLETLEQITRDLLSYALYHFETEEELMQQYGYIAAEDGQREKEHLDQHRAFSTKVVAVREGLRAGNLIAADELLGFLNGWLVNHILNTDKRLGEFITAKRTASGT